MKGPPGAGKTLVLLAMAQNFVNIVDDVKKRVFIYVRSVHKLLTEHLRKCVKSDDQLCNRVIVGDETVRSGDSWWKSDIILIDEASLFEKKQFYDELKKVEKSQSIVMFTSMRELATHYTDGFQNLAGEKIKFQCEKLPQSLRATSKLTGFVKGYADLGLNKLWMTPKAGVAIEGSDPEVVCIRNPWEEKDKFLKKSIDKLKSKYPVLAL